MLIPHILLHESEVIHLDELDVKCIDVLSQYCIYLIKEKRFCDARDIGIAIEKVLNTQKTNKIYGTLSSEK